MFDMPVPEGWKLVKLSDLGEVNRGRSRHRPRDAAHLYGGPYPFVQTGDVKASGGRVTNYTQSYSEDGLAQSRLWPKGTMCITIAANIAETGVLQFPACFPDSVIGFIPDETKCNVYFIEYVFRLLKRRIQAQATGSVQDNINLQTLERLLFPIPELDVQNKIVDVLCAFDDKIELNRQTNQTLEHIAQAIFKNWFVDFEPTRAKIAAKQAGLDPERAAMAAISGKTLEALDQLGSGQQEQLKATAALFPDVLLESELGEVPEGWSVSNLKLETSKIGSGSTPRGGKGAYKEEGISQIRSMNVFDGNFSMKDLAKIDDSQAAKLKNVIVEENDVLINITGASVTRCCIVPPSVLPARVNQHVCIVRADGETMNSYYIYQSLISSAGKSLLISLAQAGATREALTKAHIEDFELIVPDMKLLDEFGSRAADIEDMRFRLDENSLTLGAVRDSLLPKLLSGELITGN
jgi:type I restriction enzyme S subunit